MSEETVEPKQVTMTVACTKKKCANYQLSIEVLTWEHATVSCGPCGTVLVADVPELEKSAP